MYYYLVSAIKRRLILELQDSFNRHPVYSKVAPFIRNKFAFQERPQFGIIVRGSSSNKVQLSSDNFVGTIQSYAMLTPIGEPAYLLEWVREDTSFLRAHGNRMPTEPGIYYFECLRAPESPNETGSFVVDPLITVTDEVLFKASTGIEREAQLQNLPVPKTLRIFENRRHQLLEGRDYEVDYATGAVRVLTRLYPGGLLTADYRYAIPSIGPIDYRWNQADTSTLPGIVLAFGKRGKMGDKMAVVVTSDRVDVSNAYGGKFELNFDLDVISQDPYQLEEIADYAIMALWGDKKGILENEGIEVLDVSMGGEAEEESDNAGQFFYTASLSVQFRADWEMHVPLPLTFARASFDSREGEAQVDPETRRGGVSNLRAVGPSKLFFATAPILRGRNSDYERIT